MTRTLLRRPSPATLIAMLALFVALDGPATAAKLIRGSQIKSSTITSKHIKNRSLRTSDMSSSTVRSLKRTAANSITGAHIVDRSVANADLAPNSVGQGKIINGSVTGHEIANSTIGTTQVADGALTAADVTRFSGSFSLDFPAIQPQSCHGMNPDGLAPQVQNVDLVNDVIVGTPPAAWPDGLTFTIHRANATPNRIRVVVCNPGAAAIDPPAGSFHYAVFAK